MASEIKKKKDEGTPVDRSKDIKVKKKIEPMKGKKDNYEKKPSEVLKKKRSTSSGFMPR